MVWTSLNESICSLGPGTFTMYGKEANGNTAFIHIINRDFYDFASIHNCMWELAYGNI